MLGELAYWMHYYLVKLVRVKKEKTVPVVNSHVCQYFDDNYFD